MQLEALSKREETTDKTGRSSFAKFDSHLTHERTVNVPTLANSDLSHVK